MSCGNQVPFQERPSSWCIKYPTDCKNGTSRSGWHNWL